MLPASCDIICFNDILKVVSDKMDNIINPLYVVIAIAVAAVFIYVMINGFLRWSKSSAVPVVTVKATVSDKRKVEASGDGDRNNRTAGEYYASFLNSNGAEKELRITKNEYEALIPGMAGTLIFRGSIMLSFEAAECSSDENEVESNEK